MIDIFHFFTVRLKWQELEGVYFHFHYESVPVSILKWIFCSISLLFIFDFDKIKIVKQHFILCIICGIIISSNIIYGPIRSSIVGAVMLLDILSILTVLYFSKMAKLNFKVRLMHYSSSCLIYYLLHELEQIGDYFYL